MLAKVNFENMTARHITKMDSRCNGPFTSKTDMKQLTLKMSSKLMDLPLLKVMDPIQMKITQKWKLTYFRRLFY
jgi:hypothetical protein